MFFDDFGTQPQNCHAKCLAWKCEVKTHEENTISISNFIIFISSFLIGRAIRDFQIFQDAIFYQIYQRNIIFGRTICTTLAIGHWKHGFYTFKRRPPPYIPLGSRLLNSGLV
jgi:hypothetical protein